MERVEREGGKGGKKGRVERFEIEGGREGKRNCLKEFTLIHALVFKSKLGLGSIIIILSTIMTRKFGSTLAKATQVCTCIKGCPVILAYTKANVFISVHSFKTYSNSLSISDFAVRNCLMSRNEIVKLGDYGLTRNTFKVYTCMCVCCKCCCRKK